MADLGPGRQVIEGRRTDGGIELPIGAPLVDPPFPDLVMDRHVLEKRRATVPQPRRTIKVGIEARQEAAQVLPGDLWSHARALLAQSREARETMLLNRGSEGYALTKVAWLAVQERAIALRDEILKRHGLNGLVQFEELAHAEQA